MAFQPAPEPPTPLGRLRILGPRCGLRVSPLALGAMSIGQAWSGFFGSLDKKGAFDLLDAFYEAGGNFIDTANNYQFEESEKWIGEWMAARGNRDEMVIATKYTTLYAQSGNIKANFSGNHYKSMFVSTNDSLKKLQTDYIDILYLHWWDWTTSVEEVMQGLNNLVKAGKVLYLGVSDTPAWIVSKANQYARDHGLAQFVVYQGKWSVAERDFEREILQMAKAEGMALCPWNVLGGGRLQTKKQLEERNKAGEKSRANLREQSEHYIQISAALEEVAAELSVDIQAICVAYVLQKQSYVFPLIGGRKIEHLKGNIKALEIELTPKQIEKLEGAAPFDIGFPLSMISAPDKGPSYLMAAAGVHDIVQYDTPITVSGRKTEPPKNPFA